MPEAVLSDSWVDEPPLEAVPAPPPTQDELPCDDGEPMETQRHKWQMDILIYTLDRWLEQRDEGYVNGNMFVYFSLDQIRGQDFKGPDVFAVLETPRGERKSWVVWQEGRGPDVIIELLSRSTANYDKGEKKLVYQNQLRTPEYFWFNPFDPEDRAGFYLNDGVYEPIALDEQGRLTSRRLNLTLALWRGVYQGLEGTWLRWATPAGELLPTDAEAAQRQAEQSQRQAEQSQRQAEQSQRQAEQSQRQAEREKQRADSEAASRQAAEIEIERLRALLERQA